MRPMLASPVDDINKLRYPVIGSPKIDGIRAILTENGLVSRTLKPFPNKYINEMWKEIARKNPQMIGLDGELCAGPDNAFDLMQRTTSALMSINGEPEVWYHIFDMWNCPNIPYTDRREIFINIFASTTVGNLRIVHQRYLTLPTEVELFEQQALADGFEGIMLRSPDSLYKHGRSTLREQYLLKVKRFVDAEATIVGYEPLYTNLNSATINALGLKERSTRQENKVEQPLLGSLTVMPFNSSITFNIGSGFTQEQRAALWVQRHNLYGKTITYKSFAQVGTVNAPRFPIFKSFRDPIDIG